MEESSELERSELESSNSSATEASLSPPEEGYDAGKTITIVCSGKSGAGKSTFIANLFDIEDAVKKRISAKPISTKEESWTRERNGITIKIVDTVGGSEIKEKQFHLLVYCMPIGPSSKFIENIEIIKNLHDNFGDNIFKHCVIACTFSNQAWDHVDKDFKAYKSHIQEYIQEFQDFAGKLGAPNVNVKTVYDKDFGTYQDDNIIPSVPIGKDKHDNEILPKIERSWPDIIFEQMLEKCAKEKQPQLLQYQLGHQIKRFFKSRKGHVGVIGGAGGGAAVITGAVVGAAAGIPLGPPGMIMGGMVGAGAGTVGVFVASGTITGVMAIKGKVEEHKAKKEQAKSKSN